MEIIGAKMIHIEIDKNYNFSIKQSLTLFNLFFKQARIKEKYFMVSNLFWEKGYIKNTNLFRCRKRIDSFLNDKLGQNIDGESLACFVLFDGEELLFRFSTVKELDNSISCYMVSLLDCKRVTGDEFIEKFIGFTKESIGEGFIIKISEEGKNN